MRTSADANALIERAAALMGTTVSSFMLQNAYEAASRVVFEYEATWLALFASLVEWLVVLCSLQNTLRRQHEEHKKVRASPRFFYVPDSDRKRVFLQRQRKINRLRAFAESGLNVGLGL